MWQIAELKQNHLNPQSSFKTLINHCLTAFYYKNYNLIKIYFNFYSYFLFVII